MNQTLQVMKKILMALMLCIVSICVFGQSLSQAKKPNNLFEFVNYGIAQRIYINSAGQYIMSLRVYAEQNGTFLVNVGVVTVGNVGDTQYDGGYIDILLGSNKSEALQSIEWLENLYKTSKVPVMIEHGGKTITFVRQKFWISGLLVTDSDVTNGYSIILCQRKFINFYKEAIQSGELIMVSNGGYKIKLKPKDKNKTTCSTSDCLGSVKAFDKEKTKRSFTY